MNGFEKRTANKKDAITDAARELFCARGIQAVSIKEIAAAAGVSQVSIYNYFGDKNALAKATFAAIIDDAVSSYQAIMQSDLSFDEKMNAVMAHKGDLAEKIAASHLGEQAWDDASLRQLFRESVREQAVNLYRDFIELGKKEGKIDSAIPTEAAVQYIELSLAMFQQPGFLGTDAAYKTGMMHLFLYGLMGKKG